MQNAAEPESTSKEIKTVLLDKMKENPDVKRKRGTSLAVQWLGHVHASTAEGMSSNPGWGTKLSHAAQGGQRNEYKLSGCCIKKKKKEEEEGKENVQKNKLGLLVFFQREGKEDLPAIR